MDNEDKKVEETLPEGEEDIAAEVVEAKEDFVPPISVTETEPDSKVVDEAAEEDPNADNPFADEYEPEISQPEPESEPEPAPEPEPEPEPIPDHFDYESEDLAAIDVARLSFFKTYKKYNRIKTFVTIGLVALVIVAYIVPTFIEATKSYALYFALGAIGLAAVVVLVYSFLFKKKSQAWIHDYFLKYYENTYKFAFKDLHVEGLSADIDAKITDEEFNASKLYKDIFKVGSRYGLNFSYEGMDCFLIDCAAETKGEKRLETAFVGKSLRTPNTYEGSGLYIYFKGNKRAIPPNNIKSFNELENNKTLAIYGDQDQRKYLTRAIMTELNKIETNKVLVDLAISIQPGKTHFMLGYEDTLMIIPMESAYNPNPTIEFKKNLEQILNIALLFNKKK